MIPACRDKTSARLAGTNFTLRLNGKFKSHPGRAGQISTRHLFTFFNAKTEFFQSMRNF